MKVLERVVLESTEEAEALALKYAGKKGEFCSGPSTGTEYPQEAIVVENSKPYRYAEGMCVYSILTKEGFPHLFE